MKDVKALFQAKIRRDGLVAYHAAVILVLTLSCLAFHGGPLG